MRITDQEAWEYLGFFEEPDPVTLRQIKRTIAAAEAYLIGATGSKAHSASDPRAKELALMAFGFLYDNRSLEGKGSGQMSALKSSLLLQLKCEFDQLGGDDLEKSG